ncbi:MAG: DUF1992 domain-containing protein [Candidatus Adiutrix intracellularis]|jgi:hypothetical protein|nr:DUF1992 domain-containing protein [Candidatus Adiutrix intracellularis]
MVSSSDINILTLLAEQKIIDAMAEGQFDNLPGRGHPQELEDLSHLPADLRPAYIILKNNGYLEGPVEKTWSRNIHDLLAQIPDEGRNYAQLERLNFLLTYVRYRKKPSTSSPAETLETLDPTYLDKILTRI